MPLNERHFLCIINRFAKWLSLGMWGHGGVAGLVCNVKFE